jgi:hypothetical protein
MLQGPFWEISLRSADQSFFPFMETQSPDDLTNPLHVREPVFLKSAFLHTLIYDCVQIRLFPSFFPGNITEIYQRRFLLVQSIQFSWSLTRY